MSRYLSISARNEPFALGQLDPDKRLVFSLNFDIQIDGSIVGLIEQEIITRLSESGIGTQYTLSNPSGIIFIGPKAIIPTGPGPYINILSTGGVYPIEFHNNHKIRRPSVQILVYSNSYTVGTTKAYEIFNSLHGFRRQVLNAS